MLTSLYSIRSRRDADGFTLIELLVVVIIIGLLAAIALPIFIDQTRTSVDASVKSDVRNTVTNVSNAQAQKLANAKAAVSDANTNIALVAATTEVATKGALTLGNVPELGDSYSVHGWNSNGKLYLGTVANPAWTFTAASGKFAQGSGIAPSAGAAVDPGSGSGSTGGSGGSGSPIYGTGGTYTTATSVAAPNGAPYYLAANSAGDVYYTASSYAAIMKLPAGGSAQTFAGGAATAPSADGTGSAARFKQALALTLDAAGNLYVVDNNTSTVKIRKVTAAGVVTTLTELSTDVNYGILATGPDGSIYYATQKSGAATAIVKIDAGTGAQSTVFSLSGISRSINAIWVGPSGSIYVTFTDGTVAKVTGANTYTSYTLTGSTSARMLTGDSAENLYVSADTKIYKVPSGSTTGTAIAGAGTSVESAMSGAYGIHMAPSGKLYYWQTTPATLKYLS